VTEGPFKWSRNPIYVGNAVILLGFLFLTGSPWFLLMSALFVVLVDRLAIRGEERHMEALFGEAWRRYAASVRRWI
jgi:protein-S-isoprenylcysteine O-methyltransferase Ste14